MNSVNELELRIDAAAWNSLSNLADATRQAFNAAVKVSGLAGETPVSATIVLSDNLAVEELNTRWRSKLEPTNVLSFPAPVGEKTETGYRYVGDMILAFEVVNKEATHQGKGLETHLCHLVIHGALHLLGFVHQNDDEAEQMEGLEIAAMKILDLPNPYLPNSAKQKTDV